MARSPLPGKRGATVIEQTCGECWLEWVEEQTRLINHERLSPAEAEHRAQLYAKMADFLKLEG